MGRWEIEPGGSREHGALLCNPAGRQQPIPASAPDLLKTALPCERAPHPGATKGLPLSAVTQIYSDFGKHIGAAWEKKNQSIKIKHSRAKFQFSKGCFSSESDPLGVLEERTDWERGVCAWSFALGRAQTPACPPRQAASGP